MMRRRPEPEPEPEPKAELVAPAGLGALLGCGGARGPRRPGLRPPGASSSAARGAVRPMNTTASEDTRRPGDGDGHPTATENTRVEHI